MAARPRGKGQVLDDWAVDATGDVCWFWTEHAETALDANALNQSVEGRDN